MNELNKTGTTSLNCAFAHLLLLFFDAAFERFFFLFYSKTNNVCFDLVKSYCNSLIFIQNTFPSLPLASTMAAKHIFVLDNGGFNIKAGFANNAEPR
jgi:hypothetical protein